MPVKKTTMVKPEPVIGETIGKSREEFKDITKWQKEVTKGEMEALTEYTGNAFDSIKALQEKLLVDKIKIKSLEGNSLKTAEYIANLEKLIDAGPNFSGEIYRGLKFINKEKADAFINSMKNNFSFKSFQSFSANFKIADGFSASKHPIILRFKKAPKRALDVSDFAGRFKSEREILIGSNSKYKIIKISKKRQAEIKITIVDLEEVL